MAQVVYALGTFGTADALTSGGVIVPTTIPLTFQLLAADTAATARATLNAAYQLIAVREAHSVTGGASCAVQIEKLTGTTAPGSGTAQLTSTIDLTATVNTVVSGTLSATASDLQFAAGNRIGIKLSGTQTGLVGSVTLFFKRI
jgi:hypothetical protein